MSDTPIMFERKLNCAEWLKPNLAMELAAGLRPAAQIAERYGLTPQDLRELLGYPPFRAMVRDARQTWTNDMNAEQRVRAKAALAVEDTIPDLHGIIVDSSVRPRERNDAFAKLARVAQLDAPPMAGVTGSNFSVTINLPGGEPITVVPNTSPQTLEHDA